MIARHPSNTATLPVSVSFVDLDDEPLGDVGNVDLVFDVIGGDVQKQSVGLVRAGGTLVTIVGRQTRARLMVERWTSSSSAIASTSRDRVYATDGCGGTRGSARRAWGGAIRGRHSVLRASSRKHSVGNGLLTTRPARRSCARQSVNCAL